MALGEQGDNGAHALTGRKGVQVEQTATQTGQTRRPGGKGLPVQHCEASPGTETPTSRTKVGVPQSGQVSRTGTLANTKGSVQIEIALCFLPDRFPWRPASCRGGQQGTQRWSLREPQANKDRKAVATAPSSRDDEYTQFLGCFTSHMPPKQARVDFPA